MLTIRSYNRKEGDFSPEVTGLKRNLSTSNPAEESSQRNTYWFAFKLCLIQIVVKAQLCIFT